MGEQKKSIRRTIKGIMLQSLPGMITCAEFEQFIVDYLDDTLPVAQRKLFERHLRVCRECKDYLARYQLNQKIYTQYYQADAEIKSKTLDEDIPEDLIAAVIKASSGS